MSSKQRTERVILIDIQYCKATENMQWKQNVVQSLKNQINVALVFPPTQKFVGKLMVLLITEKLQAPSRNLP
jgi:hypothetical protein